MTEDDLLHRLLDTIQPMCEVGRPSEDHPLPNSAPCPANAVYIIHFRCERHGGEHMVSFCTGHRNMLHNIIEKMNRNGHPHRVLTEDLLR